jgi:hypothetical protein
MFKALSAMNQLIGALVAVAILGVVGVGGWLGYRFFFADRFEAERNEQKLIEQELQIQELTSQLEAASVENQRLVTANRLLKVDARLARLKVINQEGSKEEGNLRTYFSFVEVDEQGNPLDKEKVGSVEGDVVYVDGLVVKYLDEYVEDGDDPMRATSACLFRRIFGEKQQPAEGMPLDPVGNRPAAYRAGYEMSAEERQIWDNFWEIANNPELAKEAGVRAAHGEAPYMQLKPGKTYRIQLRASGGLTIVPEKDQPPPIDRAT